MSRADRRVTLLYPFPDYAHYPRLCEKEKLVNGYPQRLLVFQAPNETHSLSSQTSSTPSTFLPHLLSCAPGWHSTHPSPNSGFVCGWIGLQGKLSRSALCFSVTGRSCTRLQGKHFFFFALFGCLETEGKRKKKIVTLVCVINWIWKMWNCNLKGWRSVRFWGD